MAYTTIVAGTTITASWGNTDVRDQVVVPFASTSARDSAITSPVAGMVEYLKTNGTDEGLTTRTSAATWRKPWNLPWGIIGSPANVTANVASISTETTIGGTVPTVNANRRMKITVAFTGVVCTTASGDTAYSRIYRDSTKIAENSHLSIASAQPAAGSPPMALDVPSAGSPNYQFRFVRLGGSGTWTVLANATAPVIVLAEDIGPFGAPA